MNKIVKIICAALMCAVMLISLSSCAGKSSDPEPRVPESAENIGNGKRVYFASPMFSAADKEFNLRVTAVLEEAGYEVFLPQRDGVEAALLEGKTEEELIDIIFPLDVQHVTEADIVFMNIDGRVPDEGACVELGMAYSLNKRCYGFKTDTHSVEQGMDINPMISGCMIKLFKNYDGDDLIREIKEYLAENEL